MIIEVKVPMLAESVTEASLLIWHKKIGESVKRNEHLIDIETDKVTLEVTAPCDGVLLEIVKQDGTVVNSDELIAKIETVTKSSSDIPDSDIPDSGSPDDTAQQDTSAQTPENAIKLSPAVKNLLSEHQLKVTDIKTHKRPERLTKVDVLNHLSTMLHNADLPGTKQPDLKQPDLKQPELLDKPSATNLIMQDPPLPDNVDPDNQIQQALSSSSNIGQQQRPQTRVAMTRLRKHAAKRLLAAQNECALLTTFNEVNMQAVTDLRQNYKEEFEVIHGIKLGFMSFFTQAVVAALKRFPIINAAIEGEDIVYHEYFDIGIAINAKRGLLVPILRDADKLSPAAIESSIKKFAEKANNDKLSIEELDGGTFTITNGGVFGSLLSTPIINPPQSAILGMHTIQQRPIVENGQIVIRPMMYLALSYDHRIIDGRQAVQFLISVKAKIEDPSKLLLQI